MGSVEPASSRIARDRDRTDGFTSYRLVGARSGGDFRRAGRGPRGRLSCCGSRLEPGNPGETPMTKVSAGVLTGILLGVLYGFYNVHGQATATTLSASLLGRSAQGIINGV